jgi:hypothetical protein
MDAKHADVNGVAHLDDVHKGFNVGSEVKGIFIDPLIIANVVFLVVGHGKLPPVSLFCPQKIRTRVLCPYRTVLEYFLPAPA